MDDSKILLAREYVSKLAELLGADSIEKSPFTLSPEEMDKVSVTEKSGIMAFVREINKVIPLNMKPLNGTKVLKWLLANGYLEEVDQEDGRKPRMPSAMGNSIGITTEKRFGSHGPFTAVEYDANAQRFILDNIDAIIGS